MKSMQVLSETVANTACHQVQVNVLNIKTGVQHHFFIHPGTLTVCKKKLLPGGTGELVKSEPYSLNYTRLGPQNYILSLEHTSAGTIHAENVKGHEAKLLKSDPAFFVSGFNELTEACFLREFYIPCVRFPKTQVAPFADKRVTHNRLKTMVSTLQAQNKTQAPAANNILHMNMLWSPNSRLQAQKDKKATNAFRNKDRRSLLSMQSAKRMLFFNRNATSRMRSLFCNKPVNFARNLCLSVALAHAGKHTQDGMLLMHTMQYVPLPQSKQEALAKLQLEKPASILCYLTAPTTASTEPSREKVALYEVPQSTIEALQEEGLVLRGATAYVAFTKEKSQPLFIGNVDSLRLEAAIHPTKQHARAWQGAENANTTRLWLHAAATEHKMVQKALLPLLHSLHTENDLFASHTAFELWHSSKLT